MNQFSIQFDRQLVDATFVLPNQSDDREKETSVENAQSILNDDSPNELSQQSQIELEELNTRKQLLQSVEVMARQLSQVHADQKKLREELVSRFDFIAVQIADFIFREDSDLAASRLRTCLTTALETLDQPSEILVNVHPEQLPSILDSLADLPHSDLLKISADPNIGVGDCRVEQNSEGLYASLEDQLARVAVRLNKSVDRERQAS